jgi:hypothetical protein
MTGQEAKAAFLALGAVWFGLFVVIALRGGRTFVFRNEPVDRVVNPRLYWIGIGFWCVMTFGWIVAAVLTYLSPP